MCKPHIQRSQWLRLSSSQQFYDFPTCSLWHAIFSICLYFSAAALSPGCTGRSSSEPIKVGYAIAYNSFSSWQGKSLFLEDLYVKPAYRNLGIGRRLFTYVSRMAAEAGCSQLDFHVLKWNRAQKFYEAMGAANITRYNVYRMTSDAMDALRAQDD